MRFSLDLPEPRGEFDWNTVLFFLHCTQLPWDWERRADKANGGFGSENLCWLQLTAAPLHLVIPVFIFHSPAIDSKADLKGSLGCCGCWVHSRNRWHISRLVPTGALRKLRLWTAAAHGVHPLRRDSLMNVSGALIRLCILNITSLFWRCYYLRACDYSPRW